MKKMDYRAKDHQNRREHKAESRKVTRFPPINSGYTWDPMPDYMRDSPAPNPIIPYPYQLEAMERERVELPAERGRQLKDRSQMQQERQEAILRRICGTVPDRDSPLNHSTRSNCRVRDNIRLEPLRKIQSTSFASDANASSEILRRPSLDKPQRKERPQDLQPAVSMGTCTSVDLCTPMDLSSPDELHVLSTQMTTAPQPTVAKPSKLPRLLDLLQRAKNVCETYEVPVSRKDSTVSVGTVSKPVASKRSGVRARVSERRVSGACREDGGSQDVPGSNNKPAQERDTPRAAAVGQGPGDVAETLGLVKLLPLVRPELGLSQTFQLLEHEDWEKKIEGLRIVRSLAQNHTDVLLPKLHDVCLAVVEEVKNLRSMVSRAAMTTLAHMFTHLRRAMDPEAEEAVRVLLHKAGESSLFIREDVDLALGAMVQSCSPRRVMLALLAGGLNHRNGAVRKTTALHLEKLAQLLGASRLLTGKKDLTERFLTAISRLALDAAQEVRFHARLCIKCLATHKAFMKMVDKFVPPKDRSSIKDIIMKGR